jgi:hypothetical protein
VPELLEADQTVLLGGGIVLFFVILFAYFRRVGLVLVSLAAVAPAYVLMLALMALMGRPVTILTSFIPIVILVVGVCDTTHLLEHWRRARRDGMGRIDAVTHTLDGLAMSCLFTSVTTAVGFATLAATGIPVVGDFGLFTAFAVLATYAFTLTVLPALLVFVRRMPPARAPKSGLPVTLVRCARRVLARGDRWVVPAFAVVAVVAAGLASTLRIDTYLVDDLKEETRIKRDVRWIERSGFGLFQTNLFVRADAERLTASETLAWMERFQRFVESEPIVLDSYGLPDVVRSTESSRYSTISTGAVAASSWLLAPEEGAAQVVVAVRDAGSRETLAFFDRVEEHLADDPPPHGRADVTGTVRMAHTFSFHVLRSFGPSILLALGLIWLVMCALFRSVRMGLVAMVPNLFPLVTLAGAMALLGVPLKPSTILVFSIAFGIAVDDSIHLMSRYTQLMAGGRRSGRALRGALRETGPALVMSTVVVSAGFSLLLLSHFELLYLLGLLTALTAISALAADLLVFPALVALVGEVEVEEDGGDDGRIGQEREDPHLAATRGTEQRQHVVDPSEQDGPADSRRGGRSGGGLGGWAG